MRRRDTELTFTEPLDVDAAVALVVERVGAVVGGARTHDRVLLDTFDGRLRAAGVAAERTPGNGTKPPSAAALAAAGERALLPVARVRSRVRELTVRNDDDKTVVRLAVEVPEVLDGDATPVPLPARLAVRAVLGYDRAYDRTLAALTRGDDLVAAARPLFDEAALAVGRDPAGTSAKVRVPLRPGVRTDAAAGLLLARLADIAEANVPGTVEDLDVEFLHDLRVAVRRARSVLRELAGVHPPAQRAHVREELRWVQAATGPMRDLDVQLADWDALTAHLAPARRADLQPVHALFVLRRVRALADLQATLASPRFVDALASWRALAALPSAPAADPERPRAAVPVEAVAADRIRAVHRRMLRDGRAIEDASPDEALHDLRKRGKELRYLLELFGVLFPAPVVKPLVSSLKGLQDVLGRFQDRAVQAELLADAGREVARRRSGPAALMALGLVIEALHADQRAAREEFAERFEAFAADRRLVRATFDRLETA